MDNGLLNYQGDDQDWTMTELEHLKSKGRMMPGLINPTYVGSELAGLISPGGSTYDHTLDPEWRKLRGQSPANRQRFLTWDFANNRPGTKMTQLNEMRFAGKQIYDPYSKTTGDPNKPAVLYHGAMREWTDEGVKKDKLQQRDHGFYGSGFYLTPDSTLASSYAESSMLGDTMKFAGGKYSKMGDKKISPNVIPVFANSQNPFSFSDVLPKDIVKINKVLESYNVKPIKNHPIGSTEVKQRLENASDAITSELIRRGKASGRPEEEWLDDVLNYNISNILQEAGFDSAIVGNGEEVIIYEPEQVKSIWNQGTWNPLTDDLHTNLGSYLDASSTT